MERLLIVDDEPCIVEGLVQLFEEQEDLELDVGKAYSGKEAFDIVRKERIDIVLSDIRMPGVDGMALMEQTLQLWPSCKFIFLTGYSEFDYVYKAIRKPDVKYVLKTEGDDVIIGMVAEAVNKIKEQRQIQDIIEKAQRQKNVLIPFLIKELFLDILSGVKIPGLEERFDELGIPLKSCRGVLLLMGRLDCTPAHISDPGKMDLFYVLQELLNEFIDSRVLRICLILNRTELLWLLQPFGKENAVSAAEWEKMRRYVKGYLEPIQDTCRASLNATVSFAIGRNAVKWEEAHREFEALRVTLESSYFPGQEQMIIDASLPNRLLAPDATNNAFQSLELKKRMSALESCIESGNEDELKVFFKELSASVKEQFSKNWFLFMELYKSLSLMFLSFVNRENLLDEVDIERLLKLETQRSWEEAEGFYTDLGLKLCRHKKALKEDRVHHLVNLLEGHIREHLDEDLSLVRLSEVVYFNPSYLSRFYKQYTGRKLSHFIKAAKIERAKELLAETQLLIVEVGKKLGFQSASYFTSFFKKLTGLTPQEYRDSIVHTQLSR